MNIEKEKELYKQMDLLQMKEISTYRQQKNGTRIFELPIIKYDSKIQVGSFKSGYVRRMNGCYTPYQLNKCENYDHFYKDFNYNGEVYKWTGKYNKHVCRRRILIPNEVDRLEYLISYCLKNYYINQANMIENGKFIPKWKHEYEMKNGNIDTVRELQSENRRLHNIYLKQTTEIQELQKEIDKINDYNYDKIEGLNQEIRELKDKAEDAVLQEYLDNRGNVDSLSVTVNGERYNII